MILPVEPRTIIKYVQNVMGTYDHFNFCMVIDCKIKKFNLPDLCLQYTLYFIFKHFKDVKFLSFFKEIHRGFYL